MKLSMKSICINEVKNNFLKSCFFVVVSSLNYMIKAVLRLKSFLTYLRSSCKQHFEQMELGVLRTRSLKKNVIEDLSMGPQTFLAAAMYPEGDSKEVASVQNDLISSGQKLIMDM